MSSTTTSTTFTTSTTVVARLRRRALGLLAAGTVAMVATTAVAAPADAADGPRPLPAGWMTYQELALHCAMQGGIFEGGELGDPYYCVLPSGAVIWCQYQSSACVVLRVAKPVTRTKSVATTGAVLTRSA